MPRQKKQGRIWTPQQVADYLGIGEQKVRALMKSGAIYSVENGTELRTIREAVELYVLRTYLPEGAGEREIKRSYLFAQYFGDDNDTDKHV